MSLGCFESSSGFLKRTRIRILIVAVFAGLMSFSTQSFAEGSDLGPVLKYSSYLGGSGNDSGEHIALDSTHHIYLAGHTASINFPSGTITRFGRNPERTIYVLKLSPDGSEIIYSTFISKTPLDQFKHTVLGDMVVDDAGRVYLVGTTENSEFPVENPLQARIKGGLDIFITRLSSDGRRIEFSTFLGGSANEEAHGVDVTSSGDRLAVVGTTESDDFPTEKPTQAMRAGGSDAFLVELDLDDPEISYASYWGGTAEDKAYAVAYGAGTYVAGTTSSSDFPLTRPTQSELKGHSDLFVASLGPNLSHHFSTYLGGSSGENEPALAVDPQGSAVLTGTTYSLDFPVWNEFHTIHRGLSANVLVAKFSSIGVLQFSTFFGGVRKDQPNAVTVDAERNIYVAGRTYSVDFPVLTTIQPDYVGKQKCYLGGDPCSDAFLTQLGPTGKLVHSTYLGGTAYDEFTDLVLVPWGDVYLAGSTQSRDFPVLDAFQPEGDVGQYLSDAILAIISDSFQLHFAHFADGSPGGSSISSAITLTNPFAEKVATALITISDGAGNPIKVDLNGTEVQGHHQVMIPRGGGVTLETDGEGPLQVGSVVIDSDEKLSGTLLYETEMGIAGFGVSEPVTRTAMPVITRDGIATGLALVGLDKDQFLKLELKNSNGEVISLTTIALDEGAHLAKYVNEFEWDPAVEFTEFRGTLVVQGEARFAATVLRLSPNGWASLPVSN